MATSVLSSEKAPDLRGQVVPKEGPAKQEQAQADYGPNNEKLLEGDKETGLPGKPKLVAALQQMIEKMRVEGIVARRHEIRRIRQARLFWQGLQNGWWNQATGWNLPIGNVLGLAIQDPKGEAEGARFSYVLNFFRAFGETFIAVVTQDVPTVRFWPQSVQHSDDITAAKAAGDASELIEQNNDPEDLLRDIGYYLFTDGKIGGYVRYVVDGEKFGYSNEEEMEQGSAPMGEDSFVCPECGAETPEGQMQAGMFCPKCGTPLSQENFKPADMVAVPNVTGTKRLPNGQEVISIVGGLELNTPVWAREQRDFPYLQWQLEVHRGKLKASYPHVASKIEAQSPSGAEDVYARASRLSVAQGMPFLQPGDALYSLVTFLRTWIRPWAFYDLEDAAVRDELLQLFPDGCYCAFAGDVYCESRNEGLDDHWKVAHALPGEGQSRPSVSSSLIDLQLQINDYANIQAENFEFGIPPIYADPQVLDFDKLVTTVAEPGAHYPARARPGRPLAEGFYQPSPAQVDPQMQKYLEFLVGPVAQFLTGLFPAIFGGSMENVDTAKGYAMARDQALGRIGLIWRSVKSFYADVMMMSVDCFRQNRPEDVEMPILGEDDEFQSKVIRLADLKGNIQAHAEADETYPRLKSQQRATIQQLMQLGDPKVTQILEDPQNIGYIKSLLGLPDLVVPGEDSKLKQMREIEQLLQSQPVVGMSPSPAMGGMPVPEAQPSVPIDAELDDHAVEFAECKRWANSDAGQAARVENPMGFANVKAHALQHMKILQMQMMQQAMAQAAKPAPDKFGKAEEPSQKEA